MGCQLVSLDDFLIAALIFPVLVLAQNPTNCFEGNCGPSLWRAKCPFGRVQSPINILPRNLTRRRNKGSLVFSSDYYNDNTFAMTNLGNTISISIPLPENAENRPVSNLRIRGTGLSENYAFLEMHFHWGSEHTYKGRRFPLELHIVHEQVSRSGGLAVLSVMYGLKSTGSKALAPIVSAIPESAKGILTTQIMGSPVNLSALLPNVWDVFQYEGERTNGDCSKSIKYFVFTQRMPVSQSQLDVFATVEDGNGAAVQNNYRPTQPTFSGDRTAIYWMKINKADMVQAKF